MTLENPAVLTEYGNSPELRTAYAYGANAERLSASGKDAKDPAYYLYDGRGSVSETARQVKTELTLRYDASGAILSGAPAQGPAVLCMILTGISADNLVLATA